MKIIDFPKDVSAEQLAENFLEYARDGNVKWAVMVIVEQDDSLRFEWSRLPSNLAAIGAVEFLKHRLMEE
ncbi:hypothetical protein WM24_28445 [Burkholderia ubonensis]|uniref:hypothetical protein n=1 Tax=Burkholderia ubonensis TaxID=101571 RepID=UPI00075D466A|nr:hypothetical protein [Burkholderia ubonensis]KWN78996.1 hypothetical protein WM24_28445 [Burkholderia ubonensis]